MLWSLRDRDLCECKKQGECCEPECGIRLHGLLDPLTAPVPVEHHVACAPAEKIGIIRRNRNPTMVLRLGPTEPVPMARNYTFALRLRLRVCVSSSSLAVFIIRVESHRDSLTGSRQRFCSKRCPQVFRPQPQTKSSVSTKCHIRYILNGRWTPPRSSDPWRAAGCGVPRSATPSWPS